MKRLMMFLIPRSCVYGSPEGTQFPCLMGSVYCMQLATFSCWMSLPLPPPTFETFNLSKNMSFELACPFQCWSQCHKRLVFQTPSSFLMRETAVFKNSFQDRVVFFKSSVHVRFMQTGDVSLCMLTMTQPQKPRQIWSSFYWFQQDSYLFIFLIFQIIAHCEN